MSGGKHHEEYGDTFVAGLEWMWGEGFLSPGGAHEVARIVAGAPIAGARVLDVGCGLGAIDLLLVEHFGAAHVTGIDVEAPLVARAAARVEAAGLSDRISVREVSPGPFPFEDGAFDVLFSKDSMIHIPDKPTLYAEVHRVLVPGGWMVVSDWFGNGLEPTLAMHEWLDAVGLTFTLESIEASAKLVEARGFTDVQWRDRNAWYAEGHRRGARDPRGRQLPASRRAPRCGGGGAAPRKLDPEEGGRRRRRAPPRPPPRKKAGVTGAPAHRGGGFPDDVPFVPMAPGEHERLVEALTAW